MEKVKKKRGISGKRLAMVEKKQKPTLQGLILPEDYNQQLQAVGIIKKNTSTFDFCNTTTEVPQSNAQLLRIPRSSLNQEWIQVHEVHSKSQSAAALDMALRKTKLSSSELNKVETFVDTIQVYDGWKPVNTVVQQEHVVEFQLDKGMPTEKVVFSKFTKRSFS
jgi:hypothetical protein